MAVAALGAAGIGATATASTRSGWAGAVSQSCCASPFWAVHGTDQESLDRIWNATRQDTSRAPPSRERIGNGAAVFDRI